MAALWCLAWRLRARGEMDTAARREGSGMAKLARGRASELVGGQPWRSRGYLIRSLPDGIFLSVSSPRSLPPLWQAL